MARGGAVSGSSDNNDKRRGVHVRHSAGFERRRGGRAWRFLFGMMDPMSLLQSIRQRLFLGAAGQKRLLLISDQQAIVYDWEQGVFRELGRFPQESPAIDAFVTTVDQQRQGMPLHVLVDIIEEELRREVVPRLWGRNRSQVIQRRQERIFHGTPYHRCVSQGRDREGRERLLYSGLTNPDLVAPWMRALVANGIPVAGIWSVQLMSRELLQKISARSEYALLIGVHGSGLRQTFFFQGRTLISRMTPMRTGAAGEAPMAVLRDEIGRTRQYLNSLHLLPRGVTLDLFILGEERLSGVDGASWNGIIGPDGELHRPGLAAVAEKVGLQAGLTDVGVEMLYAQLLLRRPPPNHYARPEELAVVDSAGGGLLRGLFGKGGDGEPAPEMARAAPVRRLGDLLLEKGVITRDQLDTALSEQKKNRDSLGRVLVKLGFIPESVMRDLLAEMLHHESIDLTEMPPHPSALEQVPKAFAKRHGVLPVLYDPDVPSLVVATSNPLNVGVLDKLQARLGARVLVKPVLAGEGEIASAIDQFYGFELSVEGILRELETGEEDLESLSESADGFSHPMVRLVDALLTDAVKRNVSDIHIGPTAGFVRVRFRVDGVLRQIYSFHRSILSGLMVRIKVMAGMDIAETRLPQDGRITFEVAGHSVNFRVSCQPVIHGENLVLRVLDLRQEIKTTEHLNLSPESHESLMGLLKRSDGLILVTGPTGSGKTTTLYSLLNHVNSEAVNVMTMEDPVEYPMSTVLQTHVNKSIGLDYAAGIRSMLWQDPDVILVGEVHDKETATMALQAAMTGHQVLTTLHASSALGAIPRLLNLEVATDFMEGNINGIIAQRLVRRLCKACKVEDRPSPREQRLLGVGGEQPPVIYRSKGCFACFDSGYKGRFPVMEVLRVDEGFDDLIHARAAKGAFRKLAAARGVRTMLMDGLSRVLAGETSLEEIDRVLDLSALEPPPAVVSEPMEG